MRDSILAFVKKYQDVFFWISIGLSLNVGFLMVCDSPLIADEGYHLPQISAFLSGNYEVSPHLTVLPVYHAMMAGILKIIGAEFVTHARMVNLMGSAIGIIIFYLITSKLTPSERYLRTAQFVFFPFIFPMHFLIYTDAWALAFVLLAFHRALCDRPWQSAIAIAVAILIRQPNLVWIVMLWGIMIWKSDSISNVFQRIKSHWRQNTLPFLAVLVGFCIFFIWNRGVAMGDRSQHVIGLNFGNFWFFGLCTFFLFLPSCIGTTLKSASYARSHPLYSSSALAVTGIVYFLSYSATHHYNQASFWFYLRNRLLHWTASLTSVKLLSLLPALVGVLGFALTPLVERRFQIVVPLSLASIVAFPLIEQRYYLVPFALFLAVRLPTGCKGEKWNLLWYVLSSFAIHLGVARGYFFL